MALRKENFHDDEPTEKAKKRSRLTFDVSPELRRRIKIAALQNDLSIGEYLGNILEKVVPNDTQRQRHPVTQKTIDQLLKFREEFIQETNNQLFDDSAEVLRQEREKRTRYLMGEE